MRKIKTHTSYTMDIHFERFKTNQSCEDYLARVRWDNRPICSNPDCKNQHNNYYLSSRNIYKCSVCKTQFSVIQGTIFENTKLELKLWFKAMYFFLVNKRGISSCQLATALGVEQKTAWFMLHRLREALMKDENQILNGIIEVDETTIKPKIARRLKLQRKFQKMEQQALEKQKIALDAYKKEQESKYGIPYEELIKRGKKPHWIVEINGGEIPKIKDNEPKLGAPKYGPVVFGLVQRDGGIYLEIIGQSNDDITRDNIYPIIKNKVDAESHLMSDGLNLYHEVKNQGLVSKYSYIEHANNEYAKGKTHTNTIEGAWYHLKKMILGTYFHISAGYCDRYLKEFSIRYNYRKYQANALFYCFMNKVSSSSITKNNLMLNRLKYVA